MSVLSDYNTAIRLRRAAREAAYEAYKERRQRMARIEETRLLDAEYLKRRAARPFPAPLMSREEFYNPDN